jgi:hypothetical protein
VPLGTDGSNPALSSGESGANRVLARYLATRYRGPASPWSQRPCISYGCGAAAALAAAADQAPQAICELTRPMSSRNLIIKRDKPPLGDPEIRRALALTLDRKAFIDTINEGKADTQPTSRGGSGQDHARPRRDLLWLEGAPCTYLPVRTRDDRHSVEVEGDRPERRTFSSRAHLGCVSGGGVIGDSPRRNIRSVNRVSLSRSLAYRRLLSMAPKADVIRAVFPIGG